MPSPMTWNTWKWRDHPQCGDGTPRLGRSTDEISGPCGHRFSGDLTGFGRCVTGINRADTASERLGLARDNCRRVRVIDATC